MDDDLFRKLVAENISIAGVLRGLERAAVGSNYRFVWKHVHRLGLSTIHWKGQAHGTGVSNKTSSVGTLVSESSVATSLIKRIILRERLIPYRCMQCGVPPFWNGKKLTLRLDHRNGVRNDHRLENLRFLCPNCDSQTSTYCGRNKRSRARMTEGDDSKSS